MFVKAQPGPQSRRSFLASVTAVGVAALVAPSRLLANATEERVLSFVNTHTLERTTVAYFAGGEYISEELRSLRHFLRDHLTGEQHEMDTALFDLLNDLRLATGTKRPFQVISGYRSPATNAMLRQASGGVATHSLHMDGRAIDVRLADVSTSSLRDAALELQRGGVGYYRASDFVHVDTGRVRRW